MRLAVCLRLCLPLSLLLAFAGVLRGDFPELVNSEPQPETGWLPATEAAATMQVPDGFAVSAYASEPEVQNPIDLAWDSRGRLWVAENYTYAERTQRFQLDLRDRVVVLEDADGDGRHDRRTVFTDNVQMLTSVEVGHGGVWLMCPPQLLFLPDRDRDDKPDGPSQVVLDGFEVAKANYHNFANGLRFGPDGWLYGRCGGSCPGRVGPPGTPDEQRVALEGGIWRYHPVQHWFEVLTAGTTNPWGHDWNDVGELFFINTVNGHFWHGIPGAHYTRPFTLDPNPRTYELIDFHADHWHFDTGKSWTASRDGAANDYGGGHAHCGLMIYQAENWPERYRGKVFTLNLHGRRANQETLHRRGSGYVASHDEDLLIAADPWFRGMELSYGPDGSVFVLDWSDTGECHEHTGVHRTSGRVFKVSYRERDSSGNVVSDAQPPRSVIPHGDLRACDDGELVAMQDHPNAWFVRQSRKILAERAARGALDGSVAAELHRRFRDANSSEVEAIRALLTGHVSGGDRGALLEALGHRSPHVRGWGIRLLTETWPLDDCYGPVWRNEEQKARCRREAKQLLPRLVELAAGDPSPHVRLVLASTLQRLPVEFRSELAQALVTHGEDAGDHNLPLMIWYGLMPVADSHPDDLVTVAAACELPTTRRLIIRRLGEDIETNPEPLNRLIERAARTDDEAWRLDLLRGLSEAMRGWRVAPKPEAWDALASAVSGETAERLVRELSVVFGDGRSLAEVKRLVADENQSPDTRLSALATLIQSRPDDLRQICQPLLRDARLNVLAAQGLASIDDPEVGAMLVARYRNFRAPQRPKIVSLLCSRSSFADALLDAIEAGKIPRDDLSAFQVRQLHSLGNAALSRRVSEVWGEVRETPEEKRQAIESLREALSGEGLAGADRVAGRRLFAKSCQNCHRLYGDGGEIGPDLTGSNRSNLDYLLGNVIDPSAVVDKDYRMTIVVTADGRVLSGLVTARTERTLTLHTATESLNLDRREVADEKVTEKSPMPEGLLDNLSAEEIRDLVAYLSHPGQVALPESTAAAD